MIKLGDAVYKIRSKNAGPFWVTIDVFCGDARVFDEVVNHVETAQVAKIFDIPTQTIKRFDISTLNVVKFSIPRPVIQGDRFDRDMHGAQWSMLLEEIELPDFRP